MKFQYWILVLSFLCSGGSLRAQEPTNDLPDLINALFEPDSRTNLTITTYSNCPPQFTNVFSNTNLFTPDKQRLFQEIFSRYKRISTNSGPPGSVLSGTEETNGYTIAHFRYPDSGAHEDIYFEHKPVTRPQGGGYNELIFSFSPSILARFRAKEGSGYDAIVSPNLQNIVMVTQIKNEMPDGLFVNGANHQLSALLHFSNGKAVGEWLEWGVGRDNYLLQIKIESPLDYFKYMTQYLGENEP